MTSTITSKGQITIPKAIRDRLRLKVGDVLEFDETSPILLARPAFNEQAMWDVIGCAKGKLGMSAPEWIDEVRGKVENPKRSAKK